MKLAVGHRFTEGKLSQNMKWPAGDTDDGAVGPVQLSQISAAGRVMEAGEAGSWTSMAWVSGLLLFLDRSP